MAFSQYRLQDGWIVLRGPSGAAGHAANAAGEDGLFYNVRNGVLRIADNKAFARAGNVASATAIDPHVNLLRNLDDMIADVEAMGSTRDATFRQDVLRLLRQTRAAVRDGTPLPGRVQLVVHNEIGRSTGVTARLRGLGVRFIDGAVPPVAPDGNLRPHLGLRSQAAAPGTSTAVSPQSPLTVETAAGTSSRAVLVAEETAGAGAAGRALTMAGRVGSALVRAAIMAVIVLGLDYLRRGAEAERFQRKMATEQPRLEAAVRGLSSQVATLQRTSGGATVWAHMSIWIRSQTVTISSMYGGVFFDTSFEDAGFGGATVGLDYHSSRSHSYGEAMHLPSSGAVSTYTPSTETVIYSVPLPYDISTLDIATRVQRLAAIERDAARPGLPDPALELLFQEREALIGTHPR
ncbi:hypothetical protein [Humibacillus xanthopallidus]|uniref:hypothetical protein n=1 Tax=Humibacillus xanthopallidus TaxID=412689 RepID=UPI00384C4442